MALIAEFESDSVLATAALAAAPGLTLRHEEIYFTPAGQLRWACWAERGDFSAFEDGLSNAPAIDSFEVLAELEDRRLYELRYSGETGEFVYSYMTEHGIQFLELESSHHRTRVQVRAPSRAHYRELTEQWEARYGRCRTTRMYEERETEDAQVLTSKQREVLCLGLEEGYFDVPRQVPLGELSDDLGISEAAASQRIRRGLRELVAQRCRS